MAASGFTQAATEKAPARLSDGELGTESWPLTPSNRTALPTRPGVQELPPAKVAVLPLPDASAAVLPAPSSNFQEAMGGAEDPTLELHWPCTPLRPRSLGRTSSMSP